MFGQFTEKARRVVIYAQEEARRMGHNFVGTEHLLLGLIREANSLPAKVLQSLGLDLETVRGEVLKATGRGPAIGPNEEVAFTPRAKKVVLELAGEEARALGNSFIGPEHLLLGLIREGEGVAAQVLLAAGADLNHRIFRRELCRLNDLGGNLFIYKEVLAERLSHKVRG